MDFGDYFPSWPDPDYSPEENLHYIEVLVEAGDPIRDSFVDENGDKIVPPLKPNGEKPMITQEREIIEAGGYIWDSTIPGWRKP